MKNAIVLASLVASFIVITGCASQCHTPCPANEAPMHSHHDLKGEVEGK